jgi:Helix-turn-helix domain
MKTLLFDASTETAQLDELKATLRELLREGKRVAVTIAEDDELVSPAQAAKWLGFSRQHVVRLLERKELVGGRLPNSTHWKIPVSEIRAFQERRERARRQADAFSRELDAAGAPLE